MSEDLDSVRSSRSLRFRPPLQPDARGERLSAIVDGELPDVLLAEALAGLDDDARAAWSCYHLIGDALRSDELAFSPAASATFAARFAARLEAEPHVLAPAALASGASATLAGAAQQRRARRRWGAPLLSAAAAAVLTWIVVPQMDGTRGIDVSHGAGIAARDAQADAGSRIASAQQLPSAGNTGDAQAIAAQDGNIIRDAHLDAYLEAHQQFGAQPMSGEMAFIQPASFSTQTQ